MRGLILTLLLLAFVASVYADEPLVPIDVQHDASRSVTCYITPQGGISCLPDTQLKRQPNVTPDHIKKSAAPASTPNPRQAQEAFQQ